MRLALAIILVTAGCCSVKQPAAVPVDRGSIITGPTHLIGAVCPQCHSRVSVATTDLPIGAHREGDSMVADYSAQITCPNCTNHIIVEWHKRSATVVQGVELGK